MRKIFQWAMAAALICGASVFTSCSSDDNPAGEKGQLLEIYDVQGSAGKARLTVNGKVLFTTDVFVGKNGLGKTGEGDAKTPVGTLRPLSAFGIKPNPGTTMPYIDVTPTTYACDEDCEYYNQIIDTAVVHHQCKGEEMYSYQPQYNYGIATDFNKECVYPKGSAIFIHVKGTKTYTGGCIAFGVKGGVNGTKMSIDNDAVKSETGIGFFAGPTLKIDFLPFLGIQGAVLYEQANSKVNGEKIKRQSIIVPIDARLNLKFNEEAGIYLTTGPQVGFNVGDDDFTWNETSSYKSTFQMKKSMFNWNFGAGVMVTKNIEVGAVYSLGISKTGELETEIEKAKANNNELKPKSSTWQISLAYFF